MLEWLWKAAVQLVLWQLGFYPTEVDPLPRIWWIGVGILAQLPIHAAAIFTKGTVKVKMTTLQSCTSTTRTLQYSWIIAVPTTPVASPLSSINKERGRGTQTQLSKF